MTTVHGALLTPQRPKPLAQRFEAEGHLLEPEWTGRRVLVRLGLGEPHFVGYAGPLDGPADLYGAIEAEARCESAVIDGVLVEDWRDERELELDARGDEIVRSVRGRTVFAAFDLLEIDGESLLDVPLLERKRHLQGLLVPSAHVRITPFVTRNLATWGDSLKEQGFRRAVLKDLNSPYLPGETSPAWLVVERFGSKRA